MSADKTRGLPSWVKPLSRAIIALQRVGISFFSFQVITIPGRRSGRPRTTVVSPFVVDGRRYLLSFGHLDWVRNARAAGHASLARGRRSVEVRLVEVTPPESATIVREFPRQVRGGIQFFIRLGLVEPPGTPDQFAAAAGNMALFRVDPVG